MKKILLSGILLCTALLSSAANLTGDPRELSIYQVVVGSFAHSDDSAAPGYSDMWGPKDHRKDGNIKGITEKLDYIKDLGMNAIWMTPVFDSTSDDPLFAAFGGEKLMATGYFCADYFNIDPHWGTKEGFRELVDEAHKRGMYVILDGVFGHHGAPVPPSPQGNLVYGNTESDPSLPFTGGFGVDNVRGDKSGNIRYPESLPYFKEVVRYWMDEFGVDGWRLDQCYQVYQDGHNYWKDIREEVEAVARERRERGEEWGTLGYMVGEDWAAPSAVTTTRFDGLRSVFDFDGCGRLVAMTNGLAAIPLIYASPSERGYESDSIMPNLFLSNHDMSRVNDNVGDLDALKMRYAVMAGYSGPVTFYYGDEYGDLSGDGNPDNKARTSGRFAATSDDEQALRDYVAALFKARAENPAMWRGTYRYNDAPGLLEVTKTDTATGNQVLMIFPAIDTERSLSAPGIDLITGSPVEGTVSLKANIPALIKIR